MYQTDIEIIKGNKKLILEIYGKYHIYLNKNKYNY